KNHDWTWSGLCRNQIIHQEPRKARKSTKFQTTEYTEYTEKASPPGRQAQKGLFCKTKIQQQMNPTAPAARRL
ncbi:MAG: hypothetical protein IKN52_10045, partial [Victivallales bacterium]|nr:hypothetical protein [Victivallales bacterium]